MQMKGSGQSVISDNCHEKAIDKGRRALCVDKRSNSPRDLII